MALQVLPCEDVPLLGSGALSMSDTKPTNPKDAFGNIKPHVELVPDTAMLFMSLAFIEGASKYGRYNWRVLGVRASVYRAAGDRHRQKWWNGEWADPKTKVPHLASSMACDAIVLDAMACGMLIDDRPPSCHDFGALVEEAEQVVAHIMALFKDHQPQQFTINDSVVRPAETPSLLAGPL